MWSSVLSTGDHDSPIEFDIHARFYDIWGNLLAAAQFVECYSQEGIDVTMEEIIEHPSIHMQTLLLSKRMSEKGSKRQWYKITDSGKTESRKNAANILIETPPVKGRKFTKWRKSSALRVMG